MNNLYLERNSETATLPTLATDMSACFDIYADIAGRTITVFDSFNSLSEQDMLFTDLIIPPNGRALVPTGFKMQPSEGFCIKFYPRSGNSIKRGLTQSNAVGIIDRDYPNETMVPIHNTSSVPMRIDHGERVAQLAISKVESTVIVEVDTLPIIESNREGGFGSTGL